MTTTSSMEDISHENDTINAESEHRQENIITGRKHLEEGYNRTSFCKLWREATFEHHILSKEI